MQLARGLSDDPGGWWWALGALALYAVISFGLQYRTRARRGARHPARAAAHDLKDREEPQSGRQRFTSRLIMAGGAAAVVLAAAFTTGAVRVVTVGIVAVLGVTAWAYYDHRAEAGASRGQ
ncbi:hypothetical protein [Streptomyces sp. NPDC059786]|uniref:hypothetical protein n=1 Tax=Streptomyces sp. NPDC059786 TaxID=3346946 RepID=UPI003650CE07